MSLAEVLPNVQQLTRSEKMHLVRLLVEELDAEMEGLPLDPNKSYDIYSPYDAYGAGRILMEAKKQLENKRE